MEASHVDVAVDWTADDAPAPVTDEEQREAAIAWKERARQLREEYTSE